MTTRMNPTYADALRSALIEHVETEDRRQPSSWRRRVMGAGVGVVLIGGGVAVAATNWTQPGADQVTTLGSPVTVTRTGTSTVSLGTPPVGATNVELHLTCLSAGTFYFSDGASMVCTAADGASGTSTSGYTLALSRGQDSTRVTTDRPSARWRLTASFSRRTPTPWATNAHGQTYGVINDNGEEPDLLAVVATNGKSGYVYSKELDGPQPTSPAQALAWQQENAGRTRTINVYASDGTTVIGNFQIGKGRPTR